jgi:hypothetical protein
LEFAVVLELARRGRSVQDTLRITQAIGLFSPFFDDGAIAGQQEVFGEVQKVVMAVTRGPFVKMRILGGDHALNFNATLVYSLDAKPN